MVPSRDLVLYANSILCILVSLISHRLDRMGTLASNLKGAGAAPPPPPLLCMPLVHNVGVNILSRQGLRPGDWRLHPEVVELIWREFGQAQVDRKEICISRDVSLSTLVLPHASSSSWTGHNGTDVAEASSVYFSPDRSAPGSTGESSKRPGSTTSHCPAVAGQSVVPIFNIPPQRASSGASRQEGPSVPSRGLDISPPSRTVETVGLASEGAQLTDSGLSTEDFETILHSRAPSTRKLYALKWRVFTSWCSDHQQDPVNCTVGTVLEFLQERFTAGLAPPTLKFFVAAISVYHIPFGGISLGKDPLVSRFLCGTLRLRLAARTRVPRWDLAIVLQGLSSALFEPLEEVQAKFLTLKAFLLFSISSLKRIGDLQALSVAPSCLEFAPGMVKHSFTLDQVTS